MPDLTAVAVTVALIVAFAAVLWRERKEARRAVAGVCPAPTAAGGGQEYDALTTEAQKEAAVAGVKDVAELDRMWAAWESRGWSRDGIMYARVLRRREELGEELSPEDSARMARTMKAVDFGRRLPPIQGHMTRGG